MNKCKFVHQFPLRAKFLLATKQREGSEASNFQLLIRISFQNKLNCKSKLEGRNNRTFISFLSPSLRRSIGYMLTQEREKQKTD